MSDVSTLAALVIAVVAPAADEVIVLSGERQQGEVISFDAKELVLRTRERLVRLPAAKDRVALTSYLLRDSTGHVAPAVSDLPRSMCFGGRLWRRLDTEAN